MIAHDMVDPTGPVDPIVRERIKQANLSKHDWILEDDTVVTTFSIDRDGVKEMYRLTVSPDGISRGIVYFIQFPDSPKIPSCIGFSPVSKDRIYQYGNGHVSHNGYVYFMGEDDEAPDIVNGESLLNATQMKLLDNLQYRVLQALGEIENVNQSDATNWINSLAQNRTL